MPVISDEQAKTLAAGVTAIGGINNYGGGSGQYSSQAPKYAPSQFVKPQSQNLVQKILSVGKETGQLIGGGIEKGAKALGGFTVQHVVNPILRGNKVEFYDLPHQLYINYAQNDLSKKQDQIISDYKAGKISKQNYLDSMGTIGKSLSNYNKQSAQISADIHHVPGDLIDNAATALAVFTGGGSEIANVGGRTLVEGGGSTLLKSFADKAGQEQVAALAGKRGVQAFAATGGKDTLKTLIDNSSNKVEQAFLKVPAVRSVITKNLTQLLKTEAQRQLVGETTAQFVGRNAKQLAINLALKRPITYQLNIDSAKNIYTDLMTGKYGTAAATAGLQSLQLLDGGLKGAWELTGKKLFGKLGQLTYGKGSFIDEVSQRIGQNIGQHLVDLKNSGDTAAFDRSEKLWRTFQEMTLRANAEDPVAAAVAFLKNHSIAGDLDKVTIKDLESEAERHYDAQQLVKRLQAMNVKGLDPDKVKNAVVARFDRFTKASLAQAALAAGNDKGALTNAIFGADENLGTAWINNPTLARTLTRIIDESASAQEVADKIVSIPTAVGTVAGVPKSITKKLSDLGYILATPSKGLRTTQYVNYDHTRQLVSAVTEGTEEGRQIFVPASAPQPVLSYLASGLAKAGLSPQASQSAAFESLSSNVANSLDNIGVASELGFVGHATSNGQIMSGGQVILSKLEEYVSNKKANALGGAALFGKARPALVDIRQLTSKEIKEALSSKGSAISEAAAKSVQKAVINGYTQVPLELRGLGDRVVDYAYKLNPAHKYYSRIQSALRYSYNPFFQAQEGIETSMFSGLQGGNRITSLVDHHLLWNKSREELNASVKILDDARIFSGTFGGEATNEQVLGRVTANITNAQKRDLAGLAQDIAARQGRDLGELAQNNPEQLEDSLRVVVQYGKHGPLASPLARTLNIAFFPMRYNIKVTTLAAKILANQPPSVQFATLHSLMNVHSWLQSDEGIRWRAQYSDAIQVFNYLSPLNNIDAMFNTLGYVGDKVTGKPDGGVGSLGELGGLPFGIISQILDSQGIINLNNPYVEPTTGDVIPSYIPATTKARAGQAAVDLLGSMFTYPGRTLGLPGKTSTLRGLVRTFADTTAGDYNIKKYQNPDGSLTPLGQQKLSPSEKAMVRVLGGDTSQEAIDGVYTSPAQGQFNWYTMPPSSMPFNIPEPVPVETRTQVAASKAAKAGTKKAKTVAKPVGQF